MHRNASTQARYAVTTVIPPSDSTAASCRLVAWRGSHAAANLHALYDFLTPTSILTRLLDPHALLNPPHHYSAYPSAHPPPPHPPHYSPPPRPP